MNLVQINERLKDLPMQVIQQYANGMNPEVPPYLALGELQRRELSQKQMATAQGAQQGPQPSVKEQVEQKAGLMALQQMQQQQMTQQMQQPRGPMPAPEGVPQPEPQPQQEMMMARGGLAGIPVRRDMFEYAGGGIVAFQSGGQPKKYETPYDRMNRENREKAAGEPRVINLPKGTPAAAQSVNPYEARLNQVAMKEPVAPTTQDAISRVSELSPAAMQEAALQKRNQEMRDRATAYREQFEKSRPSGLDDLIRVFGQASQYKGLSGMAPAYTANKQQQRAEELAMTKQYNELMNLADTKELEGNKELFKARTGAFDTAQKLFGNEKDNVVKATASLYETTQSRINNELKMLSDKEIQMLRMDQETKIKGMEIGQRERERQSLNARDPNAKIAEYVGLKAKARELKEKGGAENIKEADRLMARAADMMEYGGRSVAAGAGPKPMTRDQALKTVGDILENPMMSRGFIADAKAALAASGIANPTMIQIQEYLVQQHMKGADLAAPTQTGLPSGVTVKRVGP